MSDLSLIVGSERIHETPIITSLGCPFDCTFCTVTMMFGRKYRMRSPESVIAELEAKKPRAVFFYDDNFAADKRRLKKLLQMMIDRGITPKWQAQVRTDVARDEELLTLMRRSGCHRVALGFESVDQATLDSYAKSQTVEDIKARSPPCTATASSATACSWWAPTTTPNARQATSSPLPSDTASTA